MSAPDSLGVCSTTVVVLTVVTTVVTVVVVVGVFVSATVLVTVSDLGPHPRGRPQPPLARAGGWRPVRPSTLRMCGGLCSGQGQGYWRGVALCIVSAIAVALRQPFISYFKITHRRVRVFASFSRNRSFTNLWRYDWVLNLSFSD